MSGKPGPRESLFDRKPELYDAIVDWPQRLAAEEPFYRRLFDRAAAHKLLDVACGTGRHAAVFHSWGLTVEGADLSEAMIERCRMLHGESDTLRWRARSFEEPPEDRDFDVAICVGNSLALATDRDAARRAIGAMFASLRSGGVCVIQVLNVWRFEQGPTTWKTCRRVKIDDEERILLKGVHRVGSYAYIDVVELDPAVDVIEPWYRSSRLLGFEPDELLAMAREFGGGEGQAFGSYDEAPFERNAGQDIIISVAKQ